MEEIMPKGKVPQKTTWDRSKDIGGVVDYFHLLSLSFNNPCNFWAWLDNPCGHPNEPQEDNQLLLPFDGLGQHLNAAT
jgi:hypothetical protein